MVAVAGALALASVLVACGDEGSGSRGTVDEPPTIMVGTITISRNGERPRRRRGADVPFSR
jgi:hypothetical protein